MKLQVPKTATMLRMVDWWFVAPVLILVVFGLVMQYSIAANQEPADFSAFYSQLSYAVIGLCAFVAALFIDPRVFRTYPFIYAALAAALLVAVLVFGTTIKGTTGWFIIAGYSFQPVEAVKLLLILFLASFFAQDATRMRRPSYFLASAATAAVMVGLVVFQPDLGSAVILFIIWLGIAAVLRAPSWGLAAAVLGIVLTFVLGWVVFFEDYQKERLTTFLHPGSDPMGAGYNITQSIVAIGSGSVWGRGLGLGTQSQLHFLPEVTSDFIFAAIAEELGFVGVLVLLGAVLLILYRLWLGMNRTVQDFHYIFLLGVACYFGTQSILVIGMNLGLLPVTGVPLPLVSAGGSSIIITLFALGIAHRMSTGHRRSS